jgi:uncharacterized protein YndB with AHSA1/START domain
VPETPSATESIEHEVRIEARPETVFGFFTDPARLVSWMGTDATLDPRPGGIFHLRFVREVGQVAARGVFVEVVPYTRIVFTWGLEGGAFGVPPASTRVEVMLFPEGDGTLVRLVHTELPEKAVEFHQAGWKNYLRRLAVAGAGGDAGPDEFVPPGLSPQRDPGEAA